MIFKGPRIIEKILSDLFKINKVNNTNYSHNLKIISKLSEIDFNYKAYIVDIWGVLWDGIEPYENSITTLKKLINSGKL